MGRHVVRRDRTEVSTAPKGRSDSFSPTEGPCTRRQTGNVYWNVGTMLFKVLPLMRPIIITKRQLIRKVVEEGVSENKKKITTLFIYYYTKTQKGEQCLSRVGNRTTHSTYVSTKTSHYTNHFVWKGNEW